MALEPFNHLTDERHADGAELPAPVEVWEYLSSERRQHPSPADPTRPPLYKFTVEIDPAEIERYADPSQHAGALGVVRRPLRPVKIDRFAPEWSFWITEWYGFES